MKSRLFGLDKIDRLVNNNIVRALYQYRYLSNNDYGVASALYPEGELIVSLTSYGEKLHQAYLTVESLLNQSLKPNRIILWLDETKYADDNNIPIALLDQKRRGLEIRLCHDIRSYTKLVPTLEHFPDAIVITVDDDILYPLDFVERLFRSYQKDPRKVYFYRGHFMLFNSDGSPRPYLDWVAKGAKGCDLYNMPTGVSGILYPPHCFHKDIFNKDLFLSICPYADDVWFKVMTYLNGILCEKIDSFNYDKLFVPIEVDNNSSLQNINVVNGGNDRQIREVFDYYNIRGDVK